MNVKKLLLTTLAIGIAVIFAIGLLIGKENIIRTLEMANFKYFAIALGFELLSVLALTNRWRVVVNASEIETSAWKLLQITFAGISISNLTPSSRTGGEAARSYFLNKETGKRTKDTLATIIAERIFDAGFFIIVTVFAIFSSFFIFHLPIWVISILVLIAIVGILAMVIIIYTVTSEAVGMRIGMWIIKKLEGLIERFESLKEAEEKFKGEFKEHSENLKGYLRKPKLWLKAMSMSAAMWTFDILRAYFVFLAIGIEVNPVLLISLILISQAAGMLPLLPGGVGSVETARLLVLSAAGITIAGAGAHTILDRVLEFWILTFIGLIAGYYLGIKNYYIQGDEDE